MGPALKGVPQTGWPMPSGIISVKIDPNTGARLPDTLIGEFLGSILGTNSTGMTEYFYQEFPPPDAPAAGLNTNTGTGTPADPTTAPTAPPGTSP